MLADQIKKTNKENKVPNKKRTKKKNEVRNKEEENLASIAAVKIRAQTDSGGCLH